MPKEVPKPPLAGVRERRDEFNEVMLDLPPTHSVEGMSLKINGVPINNIKTIHISAGVDEVTSVSLEFCAKVFGRIGGAAVTSKLAVRIAQLSELPHA